ncbi:beta-N-acetylhexosaminidase [Idiomarina xiamenensis]|uniref:Beta-hexosaminidase n=1 Tax=Idiomarina xiamenensis 10-D-4 TaxID=740709 RepID=K2JHF5_9GAMM|nr:beta-N-acetylhexosaminidase [Idiomarina xiamenensis]EKE82771.1 beta-hexosaminidase [Idiomarina xiamenensis 10-D-4]
MSAVMVDLENTELQAEERELLAHPAVGGVIFFTRNYHDREQMAELVRQVRAAARQPLILAVDHEGGRVQRFRQGFSEIPAMGEIAERAADAEQAQYWAQELAWLMATEVQALDIDISFAPVLDINACSNVIGNRAFAHNAEAVIPLARAFIRGMHQAGMKSTGKHFPGHGSVVADSHIDIPYDERDWDTIEQVDLVPFKALAKQLDAIMPAHVIYPQVCDKPAGFSSLWLQQVLRQQLGFQGVIFSDDLAMQGATVAGNMAERAAAALSAGCDMVLACNDRVGAEQVLDSIGSSHDGNDKVYQRLARQAGLAIDTLRNHPRWLKAQEILAHWKI